VLSSISKSLDSRSLSNNFDKTDGPIGLSNAGLPGF